MHTPACNELKKGDDMLQFILTWMATIQWVGLMFGLTLLGGWLAWEFAGIIGDLLGQLQWLIQDRRRKSALHALAVTDRRLVWLGGLEDPPWVEDLTLLRRKV